MNIFLLSIFIIFLVQLVFFIFASFFKTDKVTDLAYGSTFALLSLIFLEKELGKIILTIMISIWGIRLSYYLFLRILKIGKDERFDNIRHKFFSFLGFWTLQTVSIFIIMLPAIIFYSKNMPDFFIFGSIVWLIGFIIETLADKQKYEFKKSNKGFISSGLWKYSRHPNYFGEILCWIGIYLVTFPSLEGIEHIGIISPIFITFLLVFVSGIPILEKQHEKKYGKKYLDYKKRTCVLIPWPNKK